METLLQTNSEAVELGKKNSSNIKSITPLGNQYVIKEAESVNQFQLNGKSATDKLAGVYIHGVQYYDLKNILFINNSGMANLIDLLKSLLEKDVEVQFVNVSEKIKSKIKLLGLENILRCC
jgi:ABC-type transporter Mla MlaB component